MNKNILKITILAAAIFTAAFASAEAQQSVRIKDLISVQGTDDNYLKGVGLVVGLDGTGDSQKTITSAISANMLLKWENYNIYPSQLSSKNIAIVVVTAKITAFKLEGTNIDVEVASIGDAKSLKGGQLLLTPLRGPRAMDEKDKDTQTVYAIAQGNLYIGGGKDTPQKKGAITDGALVVKAVDHNVFKKNLESNIVVLHLNQPDFNVVNAIAEKINIAPQITRTENEFEIALPIDMGEVRIAIPQAYIDKNQKVKFISELLELEIDLAGGGETRAKVIIDDKTKSWAITGSVKVSKCCVLAGDTKVVVTDADIAKGASLSDIIQTLNMAKTPPEDIIEILKKMNDAGVISAEVIIN